MEPAECVSLGPAADKKLAGKDLAACVSAAFAAYGTGTEYILWIEDNGTPVGAQATSHTGGAPKTVSQHFYDLGEPVTIEAPATGQAPGRPPRGPDRTAGPRGGGRNQQACSA